MTPELWHRLKPLYSAALDLPEEGRSGYVEQLCGADPELARELLALLAADESAGNTLDPPFHDISLFPRSRPAILPPDTLLAARFRILRHLGSGGMGDVYEALDLQMEQGHIALKTVRPAIAGDPVALARFKDEVRLARKVTGPHVCRIHELYLVDSAANAHCAAFLTMEMLEGVTLHDRIEQSSPLPLAEMRSIAEQLCDALCCIHESGIIHRDLKPRNVMLVPHNGAEKVVVMDFGLARAAEAASEGSGTSLAHPGLIVGTPSYMAPEQFEGGEVTAATDLYALGLILYELATGIQPFAAHTPLAAAVRRARRPQNASSMRTDLPPGWDEVIARCLQYDPTVRFQYASEVSMALRHPQSVVWHFGRDRRLTVSRKLLMAVSVASIVVLAVAIGLFVRNAQLRKLSPDAAHWYALGMTALREGSYIKATKLLTMVEERDPKYPVAHAALADAWTELDFTDAAQREMLLASAPGEERGLPAQQKRYIDAVRNTLIRDYSAAAQDYEAILTKLPEDRKAQGYVDLGRAYEKAGRVQETVGAYERAATLNPDDPAPFLHLGILRSRLRQHAAAQEAFAKAETLYQAESDQEGLAEVAYQRGYAAIQAGRFKDARQHLDRSLAIAHQIPSVQLEVRSLSQLSSVAYNESQDDVAIRYANQEIQFAEENGLEYWSTDGLIRLGNAYLDKRDFSAAEPVLQQAVRKAQANGHPRLSATAELTLASLRDQQKQRPDEEISLARSALKYYQDYGFLDMADQAETLILRGERDEGEFEQALQAGNQLLQIANSTHSTFSVAIAEEFVGEVLLRLERYPEALAHFEQGTRELQSLGEDPGYLQLHIAEALVPLGRIAEAQADLATISRDMRQRVDIALAIAVVNAKMQEILGDSRAALNIAQGTWQQYPSTRSESGELDCIALLAEGQQGQLQKARQSAAQLASAAYAQSKGDAAARAELLQANLALLAADGGSASAHAQAAEQFFAAKHILESQALSLFAGAEAAQITGDTVALGPLSQKSVDIFRQLEQSWGVPAFTVYANRPDRRKALHALAVMRGENGVFPNELSR